MDVRPLRVALMPFKIPGEPTCLPASFVFCATHVPNTIPTLSRFHFVKVDDYEHLGT